MSENKFVYTYAAPTEEDRREIESIKRQYSVCEGKTDASLPATELTINSLRAMHRHVERFPKTIAVLLVILGALIFGTGMSLTLVWEQYPIGVPVGIIGMALLGCIVFIHKSLLKKRQKKYGAKIVALCDMLLNEESNENVG